MFAQIRKRDGTIVDFEAKKITEAIRKAGEATEEFEAYTAKKLMLKVLALAEEAIQDDIPSVEEIQDIVEEVLLASPYRKTAKAYIIYRAHHARLRQMVAQTEMELIDQYLERLDWKVNENSNMAFSLQGLNNYVSSEISKVYWLNRIYSDEVSEAHISGDFHIHDLNCLSVYCVGWDLLDLLLEGFRGVAGKVESKPPRHLRSALGQIVNFFYTLQGEAAGAQAFSNFDTLLAPFIRHDGLTYTETKQALQEFIFNVNVPTRVGFQTPFTNITLDLTVPAHLAGQPIIIGGHPQRETYGEFQSEMDSFNRALMEVMTEGDGKGRVFTFPIPTINITGGFDWDNGAVEALWENTAKYGVAYFSNFVNSDMRPEDTRSMCCRLRLNTKELAKRGGGLFGSNPLTGSIGVVTLNMPRIGYLARSEADFLRRVERLMLLAMGSLETKRKVLEGLTDRGLYPYTRFYLRNVKERFGQYWGNHFSTIGLVGMHEGCLNLLGEGIDTPAGSRFAVRVLDFMRDRLTTFQERTGHNYNLEATPAEGTSYRLARLDRKKYPKLVFGYPESKEPFYTNSTQLPVNYTDDCFEALDRQDVLQTRYTGGTVMHLYAGERLRDTATVKKLVRTICERYHLPYFTLTPTFSICGDHGYLSGEHSTCPDCGAACEVYSRVVGYLRPVSQWNAGKQAEFSQRKVFKV